MSKYTVTSYLPSHKQHSLNPRLTPEQISEALGFTPNSSFDADKVTMQWTFYASEGFTGDPIPCCIWDYKGARWSAFGPREVFADLGLL